MQGTMAVARLVWQSFEFACFPKDNSKSHSPMMMYLRAGGNQINTSSAG
jgi:hypothetical protein